LNTDSGITPIFILSLPRSGSTLLQRLLAARDGVASAPEPWLLLPLLAPLRGDGVYADYSQVHQSEALQDFFSDLPGGEDDYLEGVRRLALHVYGQAAGPDSRYFLDKTPRYHLVCDSLFQAFPDARFIFLWRNPLGVIASMIETWGQGRWNLGQYKIDLFQGIRNLVDAYRRYEDRAIAVRFEDLVSDESGVLRRICDYLGLDRSDDEVAALSDPAWTRRKGDPTGIHKYGSVSQEPLDKWQATVCNPFRKWWCGRYVEWLGTGDLDTMGYDRPESECALK
jgi:hypothetical protein